MLDNLSSLIGNPGAATPSTSCSWGSSGSCLAGYYWSSTQAAVSPQYYAWTQYFATGGGNSDQFYLTKDNKLGVRCARALTN